MKLEQLTAEEQAFLAKRYYKTISILEQLIDEQYRNIHAEVCRAKGVFINPCPFTVLTEETNPLNDSSNMEDEISGGYCLGVYMPNKKAIAINAEAIVRMVIETSGKCNLTLCALYAIDSVAHELTHYIQDMCGDEFDMETNYRDRAHEVEARQVGKHVALKYKPNIREMLYDIQLSH